MKYYSELAIEFKSGTVFSIIALVLSIVAGFIGSVPLGMIIFRSLFIIPLFFLVGFGVFIIIKKFVPEVYEAILNFSGTAEDGLVENVDIYSDNMEDAMSEYSENAEENFTEFTEDDFDKVNSSSDNTFDTSGGKLGKHIIVDNQQLNGYEPKIMAEAIRTMMSKDKD